MEHLFKSIQLGEVTIPNRVALAPMYLGLQTVDETWPARYLRFIEERCRGEVGLIITQFTCATTVTPEKIVGSYDDRFMETHKRLVDVVHLYNSKVFLQIAASGGEVGNASPSAITSPRYPAVPRELTVKEIECIINDFAQAASRARRAGYDGVELHGAYTYLVGAFMSPHTNQRDDEYGGDFERRMRLPVNIIQAIKKEIGDDFPVGFKFSAWEELQGGVDSNLGILIAQRMVKEGVCYLHVVSTSNIVGVSGRNYPSVPTMYSPRNTLLPLAILVKHSVKNVPVIAAGAICEPDEADDMISNGDCDMVALGRALLADPHWVRKARSGERIRPCIRCNVCYHQIHSLNAIAVCTVNPYLTLEAQEPLQTANRRKKVMVVGGGPGGITAAIISHKRGHDVTLYEKGSELGGKLIPGGRPFFKMPIGRLLQYWKEELADLQIDVRYNIEVTYETVRREHPDTLIIAIGADPVMPPITGIDKSNVLTAIDAYSDYNKLSGKEVIMLGGGDVGCECAIFLNQQKSKVTIVEIEKELLTTQHILTVKADLMRMINDEGIKVLTNTSIIEIMSDKVRLRLSDKSEQTLNADYVVVAVGLKSRHSIVSELESECPDVHIIGDCLDPRRIREAIIEGDLSGRLV